MAPEELLDTVKRLEREIGRGAGAATDPAGGEPAAPERHGPREIDIDVLMLGEIEMKTDWMTLPHEQLQSRRFVLIPAVEIDMEATTPDGHRLADALAAMPPNEGVRWAGPPLKVR
jgi:2-amino-4-hydroxy-6-hydroxymethyldihydropteridine diphosphokinase